MMILWGHCNDVPVGYLGRFHIPSHKPNQKFSRLQMMDQTQIGWTLVGGVRMHFSHLCMHRMRMKIFAQLWQQQPFILMGILGSAQCNHHPKSWEHNCLLTKYLEVNNSTKFKQCQGNAFPSLQGMGSFNSYYRTYSKYLWEILF